MEEDTRVSTDRQTPQRARPAASTRAISDDPLEEVTVLEGVGKLTGLRHAGRRNNRALVFVHGFTGDAAATWLAEGATESFPRLIASDPDLADYDVYTFGYRTKLRSGSRIELLAREFNTGIEALLSAAAKTKRDYSLVLLAHSMGGLVCMRYVIDRLQARQRPPLLGLLLFGTPTTGTDLVGIVKLVAGIVALKIPVVGWVVRGWFKLQHQLTDLATASTFLAGLHDQWALRVVNGGHDSAGPDGRTWLPVRVVTGNADFFVKEASAKGVYGAIDWQAVECGHVDLVKPPTRTDPRYYHAKRFLEICRTAHRPDVQARVWNLSQAVWQTSSGKMIANLDFSTAIHHPSRTSPTGGLSACVTSCRFRTVLEAPEVTIGIAFNGIGQKEIWDIKPEPAYVHQLLLQDLSEDARDEVVQALKAAMARGPEAGWQIMFPSLTVSINGVNLIGGRIEGSQVPPYEWLRRTFASSELAHLVGEEVDLDVKIETLVQRSLASFRFVHRWLTLKSSCRISVHGRLEYFLASHRLAIGQAASVTQDGSTQVHSVLFSVNDTVLPGSSFDVRWQPTPDT